VPADQLDLFIWNHLCELLTKPGALEEAMALQYDAKGPQENVFDHQLIRIGKEVQAQQKRMERVLDLYQDGMLEKKLYQERYDKLNAKVAALESERASVEQQRAEVGRQQRLFRGVDTFRSAIKSGIANTTFGDRQRLCRLLIENIKISGEEVLVEHIVPESDNIAH
jgi:hypothetical protein